MSRNLKKFNLVWETQHFFQNINNEYSVCLICKKQLVNRLDSLKRHYNVLHKNSFDNLDMEQKQILVANYKKDIFDDMHFKFKDGSKPINVEDPMKYSIRKSYYQYPNLLLSANIFFSVNIYSTIH